ncbi:hypothetical protein [Amycolatopsis sp. NPDC049868]|uniref:hypothetical protein n=1 Tax=Amycolatopsis sp. NPDC049868 TaxID=3363934 RepID=UPI00379E6CCA
MDDVAHRRQSLLAQGYERVHVENEYWDGPVSGEDETESGEYLIWPITRSTLEAEIEHYLIFAEWLRDGQVGPHPGNPAEECSLRRARRDFGSAAQSSADISEEDRVLGILRRTSLPSRRTRVSGPVESEIT